MKKLIISSVALFVLLGPVSTFAQSTGNLPPAKVNITIKNPFSIGDNLYKILEAIVDKVLIPIGGTLCVLAFIYAGFKYVIAQGKPTEIENANRIFRYSALGTAVLLGSWTIIKVIQSTLDTIVVKW